jgi:hypothetical protein
MAHQRQCYSLKYGLHPLPVQSKSCRSYFHTLTNAREEKFVFAQNRDEPSEMDGHV